MPRNDATGVYFQQMGSRTWLHKFHKYSSTIRLPDRFEYHSGTVHYILKVCSRYIPYTYTHFSWIHVNVTTKWQGAKLVRFKDILHKYIRYLYYYRYIITYLYQFSSVAQSCATLWDPMNCGTPGLPVHHRLPEFTQTHVYWIGDAIQPSHLLSSPSPPAFNLSQHQGLFKWVSSSQTGGQSIRVSASTSVLPMNTQDWSPLRWTGCISLQSKGLSRVFSNTTVQKHQFFGTQLSL